jgi:FkbM family methyltransferase
MFKLIKSKIKGTRGYQRTKRFLKQLIGQEVRFSPQIKQSNTLCFEDWCIDPSKLDKNSVIYSVGVGEGIDFDLQLIENYGTKVYAFDPTPNSIEWLKSKKLPDNLEFCPYGLSGKDEKVKIFPRVSKKGKKSGSMFSVVNEAGDVSDGIEVQMHSLKTIMDKLGHNKIDILKMDIEASEYAVIADIVNQQLDIGQILVEFHHRFPTVGNEMTIEAVDILNKAGYKIFFISDIGREYSFIKVS